MPGALGGGLQAKSVVYVSGFFILRPKVLLFATVPRKSQGCDLGLSDGFLNITPKAQASKEKLD